jgi:hypothetical protein
MDQDTLIEAAKAAIEGFAVVVALLSFFIAMLTYLYQKKRDRDLALARERLKRFDKFQEFEKRYREEDALVKVREWIYREQNSNKVVTRPSAYDLQNFMEFFEEIAVMINSGLMNPDLASYTIGIDAARFYDTETQFHNDPYWTLFNSFAQRMKARFNPTATEPRAVRKTLTKKEVEELGF